MKGKMAIIGDGTGALVFKSVGMDAFSTGDARTAAKLLSEIAQEYQVIFVTDVLAAEMEEVIASYAAKPYPIIVPIPSVQGGNGYGAELLKRQSERALGMDILSRKGKGSDVTTDGENNAR